MSKRNNIKDYSEWVEDMWISQKSTDSLTIATLGLAGETGEVMEVLKKRLRDDKFDVENFKKEMGDVIYYWCKILNHFEIDPREILDINVTKIEDRKARNVQKGSGDNR